MSAISGSRPMRKTTVIADLYAQFGRYDLSGQLHVCMCNVCCSEQDKAALILTPVAEISCGLLSEFTNAVFGGDETEVKHFLPRYFELMLDGEIPSHLGVETALARLQHYDWRNAWPESESRALQGGFDALAIASVTENSPLTTRGGERLDSVVACGLNARADIASMLAAAMTQETRFALTQIARAITAWWPMLTASLQDDSKGPFGSNAAWGEENAAALAWLSDPRLKERLETAFWASEDPQEQKLLSDAAWLMPPASAHAPRISAIL